jgi:hypothetical protein
MKKLLFAAALIFGTVGMYSCGGNDTTATEEVEGTVIDTDTTVSELEVERTIIETDTTVNSETIDVDNVQ